MAMASSGTDPLVRLQTGSKELRAERELCQVAAEKGFSTETGGVGRGYFHTDPAPTGPSQPTHVLRPRAS